MGTNISPNKNVKSFAVSYWTISGNLEDISFTVSDFDSITPPITLVMSFGVSFVLSGIRIFKMIFAVSKTKDI